MTDVVGWLQGLWLITTTERGEGIDYAEVIGTSYQ
jgi:hypothetical protein